MIKMKFCLSFVLIFIAVVKCQNLDDIQLFSQCDRTVGTGVATCMQYFSPIKFVTDFLNSDKESLCCTHFRHTACIAGVRDAVRMAKVANLCPDSFADELVSTLTDSTLNNYIRKSCKSFNTGVCVMESVGDVVNTIQGFFIPQQQKPIVPQLTQSVSRLFNRNGNSYSVDDNRNNHNYDSDPSSLFNPFREIINQRRKVATTTTPTPFYGQSARDVYSGIQGYIPEASDINPTKDVANESQTDVHPSDSELGSLLGGLSGFLDLAGLASDRSERKDRDDTETDTDDSSESEQPSLFSGIARIINSGLNLNQNHQSAKNQTNGQNIFSDIFNLNETDSHVVKDITDSVN